MNNRRKTHPLTAELRAFAQGLLEGEAFSAVEEHVSHCDVCCHLLSDVPDSTLVNLAREAATRGFRAAPAQRNVDGVPPELEDHPRYKVLERIGVGGMGAVYKAEHRLMQRTVALKVVHPRLLSNPLAVERFEREVQLAARLSHGNIVASHDADQAGDLHFLVMEFVDGVSLDQYITEHGPAAPKQVCQWIRQAALGLQHAYEQGMAHRDIKPHNLMVTTSGQIKILDFGLTRLISPPKSAAPDDGKGDTVVPGATAEGTILGTPDYIAPEQINDSRSADIRADIYSLGCTLFFALTGRPPFPEPTLIEKLNAQATKPLPRLSEFRDDAPPRLQEILDRMTAKDPAARYTTPAEAAEALSTLIASLPGPSAAPKPSAAAPPAAAPVPATAGFPHIVTDNGAASSSATIRARVQRDKDGARSTTPWLLASAGGGILLVSVLFAAVFSGLIGGADEAPQLPPEPKKIDVLLMLPSEGLWYEDYERFVRAAQERSEAGDVRVRVVAAGMSDQPSALAPSSFQAEARRDIPLDRNVRALDYDAIVFIGANTREFGPWGDAAPATKRLLDEFKREGKVIAALCAGQRALGENNILRGKKFAYCEFTEDEVGEFGGEVVHEPVVQDGKIVTAERESFAPDLVKKIVEMIDP